MMSFDSTFSDGLITRRRKGTPDDPFLDIRELIYVTQGKAPLSEIPYKFTKVKIIEQVIGGSGGITGDVIDGGDFSGTSSSVDSSVPIGAFYEIESGVPNNNQYLTDYGEGFVTFHPSQEGSAFIVEYKGTGYKYFSDKRIVTEDYGNGIVQTLNDLTSTLPDLDEKITEAEQATLNANNATANFQTLLDEQLLIYKSSVNTYSDLATTYPTPELGWVATALDTGIRWRYDGVEWMNIGYDEVSGFRVLVSPNPPLNINSLWVNVPAGSVTKNAKVVQSETAPSDTSVIWWKTN